MIRTNGGCSSESLEQSFTKEAVRVEKKVRGGKAEASFDVQGEEKLHVFAGEADESYSSV